MPIEEQSYTRLLCEPSARLQADRSSLPADRGAGSAAREHDFVANLSHEMRTSMAAIRSDTEIMLLDRSLSTDDSERLKRIVTNVELLAVALESAREMTLDVAGAVEQVDLAASLATVWQSLRSYAHAAALTLVDRVPEGITYVVSRSGLLTVLSNLIRNAIEHAAPATLTITAIAGGIELRDNGTGISPSLVPFIFDWGCTIKQSDERGADKTRSSSSLIQHGLGLSIVKRICDLNGWRVTAHTFSDEHGSGTAFKLRFPPFFD